MKTIHSKQDLIAATETKGVSVVKFFSSTCGPCKMIAPRLDKIAEAHPQYNWSQVNITDSPIAAARFAIRMVPTVLVFLDGQKVKELRGGRLLKPLEDLLDNMGGTQNNVTEKGNDS